MQRIVIRVILVLIGASLGASFLPVLWRVINLEHTFYLDNQVVNGCLGGVIFFLLSLVLVRLIEKVIKKIDDNVSKINLKNLLYGGIGLGIGLIASAIVSIPFLFSNLELLTFSVPIILMVSLAYIGFRIGISRQEELSKIFTRKKQRIDVVLPHQEESEVLERKAGETFRKYKILDTSVIIDGRIYDIAKTGFLEGVLLIPNFVLYELQYIADSSDSLKRVRGRRGLDILNALQREKNITVEMYDGDFEEINEVDTKLLKLAKNLDGVVVTNDFNLNKVAEFQHVPILNINLLANAVKPVVIAGENMEVLIVKAGSERAQGVAYLDDGTMIVVEDGQHFMNQTIRVTVTSVLQTSAGRMIFAKADHANRGIENTK